MARFQELLKMTRDTIKSEVFPGVLLLLAAVLAIILNNSSAHSFYDELRTTKLALHIGNFSFGKPLVFWINDGLMAIFFLFVGLEIKRELFKGVLKDVSQLVLPFVGAIGGLAVPALIYIFFNSSDLTAMRGWAVPVATDIAFSLGILTLLGSRVPVALKVFLTALAIIDDILAVIIIALFYTDSLSQISLLFASLFILILFLMNRAGVKQLSPYFLVGYFLWLSVLKSGVHATIAGIIIAFAIPLGTKNNSPLLRIERALVPWVSFFILPVFAFVNAGFSFDGLTVSSLFEPIPFGIAFGLFAGKQLGIFATCWALIKGRLAKMPEGISWLDLYAVAMICGVGFTMSLFIGGLAFEKVSPEYMRMVRLGVIAGSLLSGVGGYALLRISIRFKEKLAP